MDLREDWDARDTCDEVCVWDSDDCGCGCGGGDDDISDISAQQRMSGEVWGLGTSGEKPRREKGINQSCTRLL